MPDREFRCQLNLSNVFLVSPHVLLSIGVVLPLECDRTIEGSDRVF